MARRGSLLVSFAFVNIRFMVCTVRSMNPFDCGNNGELVTCSMPYFVQKTRNSSELYWGPLSDINFSGMPCSSKIPRRWLMTVVELALLSFRTIGNLL